MPTRYYYISLLVALGALAASLYIIPNKNDVALMQMEDGDVKEAFATYRMQAKNGDFSLDVAVPLSRLYLEYGDSASAIIVMERFVALHPDNSAALKQLGGLYKSVGRMEDYLLNLKQQATLAPSQELFRALLALADFLARDDVRQLALEQLIASPGYSALEQDYFMLGYLYATQGKAREAIHVLKELFHSKNEEVSQDSIQLLLKLLIENTYKEEAFSIASIYLEKHSKSGEAARIMALFRLEGETTLALHFALPFVKDAAEHPAFLEEYLTCLLAAGKKREAKERLLVQLEKKQMPGSLPEMLFDLALTEQDGALLIRMARTVPLNTIPEETLMSAASIALLTHNMPLLAALHANLREQLAFTPLLATVLNAAEHPSATALASLARFADMPLPPKQQRMLLKIYALNKQYLPLFHLASRFPASTVLNIIEPADIAAMYLAVHQAQAGIAAYQDVAQQEGSKAGEVLLLLAAGSGDKALLISQAGRVRAQHSLLADCYGIAETYRQPAITLTLAKILYAQEKNDENRMQLADALLAGGHYKEALILLDEAVLAHKPVEQVYLDVVSAMLATHQGSMLSAHKSGFFLAVDRLLARQDVSMEAKMDAGYLLLNAGYREKAQAVFFALAQEAEPDSDAVKELLFLAGKNPDPATSNWLKTRAAASTDSAFPLWLDYLHRLHEDEAIVTLVEARQGSLASPDVTDRYIDALIALKARPRVARVLKNTLDKGCSPARCRKLAMLAIAEGLGAIAEKPLTQLLAISPDDTAVLEPLGLYYFTQGNMNKAWHYLDRYLQLAEGTPEIHMAYADILVHRQERDKAVPYYQRAVNALIALPEQNFITRSREAYIFTRLGMVQKATTLYRQLLQEQPGNNALRADFANMLIDNHLFHEAERVLKGGK